MVAGIVVSVVLSGCASPESAPAASTGPALGPPLPAGPALPTQAPDPGEPFNIYDIVFIQQMIPHHQQTLEMAELAATRATDPRLRRVASGVLAVLPGEIQQMSYALASLGIDPTTLAGGHAHAGGMTEGDVAALASLSGTEFDDRFRDLMIDHSLGAVTQAREEAQLGENGPTTRLAVEIARRESDQVLTLQR